MNEKKNEIILFENQGVKLEDIFKEGELDEKTSVGISDKRLEGNDAKEILKVIGDYSKSQ